MHYIYSQSCIVYIYVSRLIYIYIYIYFYIYKYLFVFLYYVGRPFLHINAYIRRAHHAATDRRQAITRRIEHPERGKKSADGKRCNIEPDEAVSVALPPVLYFYSQQQLIVAPFGYLLSGEGRSERDPAEKDDERTTLYT